MNFKRSGTGIQRLETKNLHFFANNLKFNAFFFYIIWYSLISTQKRKFKA